MDHSALSQSVHALPPGEHRAPCPECDHGPRDEAFGLHVEDDGSAYGACFRCGFTWSQRGSTEYRRSGNVVPFRRKQQHQSLSDYGRELWKETRAISGVAAEYLQSRRCPLPPRGSHLRWHLNLLHAPSGHSGPALVALVTDAVTRVPLSLHRTWITPTGKAAIERPRMLLGGHRKAGGVIRLWPDEEVTLGLGIAEGIETALSLSRLHAPVWSCIDAGNLAEFPVLPGIESLVIAVDNDAAGTKAAAACAARWVNADRGVSRLIPNEAGRDLNDLEVAAWTA